VGRGRGRCAGTRTITGDKFAIPSVAGPKGVGRRSAGCVVCANARRFGWLGGWAVGGSRGGDGAPMSSSSSSSSSAAAAVAAAAAVVAVVAGDDLDVVGPKGERNLLGVRRVSTYGPRERVTTSSLARDSQLPRAPRTFSLSQKDPSTRALSLSLSPFLVLGRGSSARQMFGPWHGGRMGPARPLDPPAHCVGASEMSRVPDS
jgi:hypothetical protein